MTGTVVFLVVAAVLIGIATKLMWDSKRALERRDEGRSGRSKDTPSGSSG
jgi:hypothetical protein